MSKLLSAIIVIALCTFSLATACALTPVARVPSVFVLGDSISQHYGKFLKDDLARDGIDYARKTENIFPTGSNGNGRTSADCLDYVTWKLQDSTFAPSVFVFNAGLHDVKTTDGEIATSIAEYKANLGATINLLHTRNIKVVWVRTTPIDEALYNATHDNKRYLEDIKAYNRAADTVMRSKNVPIIDLYTYTETGFDMATATEDGVHFVLTIRKRQGDYVYNRLLEVWP